MSNILTGEEVATCGECGIEGALDWVQQHFLGHFENIDPQENEGM